MIQRVRSQKVALVSALGACVALVAALTAVSGASAQAPTVSVGSFGINVGQQGNVSLRTLDIAAPGLGAWTIDVAYNPAVVTVLECAGENGSLCNAAYGPNSVRVVGTSLGGLRGDSSLATITFACNSAGASELSVSWEVLADATVGSPRTISAAAEHGAATCLQAGAPTFTPEPEPTNEPPVKNLGDANCDGLVNAIDAALELQLTAGLIDSVPCPQNADVNGDGLSNSIDAALILQIEAGLL